MVFDVMNLPPKIVLGKAGENAVTEIQFDVSAWVKDYPKANFAIVVERSDGACYPVEISHSDGLITWLVTANETVSGYGKLELRMLDGDVLAKSVVTATYVSPSLDTGDTPEPTVPDWVNKLLEQIQDLIEHGVTPEQIEVAVTEYLEKHPIDAVTREECEQIVADYVAEQGFPSFADIDREVESYVTAHKDEWISQVLPPYTSADNGKVLGIVNGTLAWVVSGSPIPPEPTPVRPDVPQTGTWQLKTTTDKKYVILGTDDDISGNPKYFRYLRSYGFPYTMNVEAERLNAYIGSDVSDEFTDSDAPSLFPNNITVLELCKYLEESGLGEVAQHGASTNRLWDSRNVSDTEWGDMYANYTSQGGSKSKDDFVNAVKENLAGCDVAQSAKYVADSRKAIEEACGFFVDTVGIWGGNPRCDIDGITVTVNGTPGDYDWRADSYTACSSSLSTYNDNVNTYDIHRESSNLGALSILKERVSVGKVIEMFVHNTEALDRTQLRADLAELKQMVDDGIVEVVTRKQYASMGEYVDNPITKITVTRISDTINVGDIDTKSAYTVIATYQDGATADVSDEAIVKIIIDTSEAKIVKVPAYYKGFTSTVIVEIVGGEGKDVNLKLVHKAKIQQATGAILHSDSYEVYMASNEPIPYDITKDYLLSCDTSTNNNSRPYIYEAYCYSADKTFLGYVIVNDAVGKCTNVALPRLDETYPNVRYFALQGQLNKTYAEAQVNGWSCTTEDR